MSEMKDAFILWTLSLSMGEEQMAESNYRLRAVQMQEYGDKETAMLFHDIANDENEHYDLLKTRLDQVRNNDIVSVALKIDVPKFKIGDKVTYKYDGVDTNGEILEEPKKIYRLGYVYKVSHPAMNNASYEYQSERTLRLACEPCSITTSTDDGYDFIGGYDTYPEAELAAKEYIDEHGNRDYKIIHKKDPNGDFHGLYVRSNQPEPKLPDGYKVARSGDLVKIGDGIYDSGLNQVGEVANITGDAQYGTVIMVDMAEPVIRTWQNADGTTGQTILSEAGPHYYTPAEFKKRVIKIEAAEPGDVKQAVSEVATKES